MLEEIIEHKRREIAAKRAAYSVEQLKASAHTAPPARDFTTALRRPGRVAVIAEIKRASPSKGPIRPGADPVEIAKIYAASGAAAISVLTDERFFQGSPVFLSLVRSAVEVPVLCKEFILDPIQIYEARGLGADALLLIVRLLEQRELAEFISLARELGMECVVEVHSPGEIEQSLAAGAKIIGINNRDLETFKTDIETTFRLKRHLPPEVVVVSESGIASPPAIRALKECGVNAVLIGEALMAAADISAKLREFVAAGA
ncbi:MAG: indole-3-glycerol phosphate synthase TrpC [Bacillota bacterium]